MYIIIIICNNNNLQNESHADIRQIRHLDVNYMKIKSLENITLFCPALDFLETQPASSLLIFGNKLLLRYFELKNFTKRRRYVITG